MLLHGGGARRQDWYTDGYIDRLKDEFTLLPVDLRGHGESDKPLDPTCYTTDKMGDDLLAVADACGLERFMICGYSFGGSVSRYLAARSDRVAKLIMIGNRLGPGVSGEFRQFALDFRARWMPVVKGSGKVFDPRSLPAREQEEIAQLSFPGELLPVVLAWSDAMLDWGTILPGDLRCPTLWLIGSENGGSLKSWEECKHLVPGSKLRVHILEGLDHGHEMSEIDQVLPVVKPFLQA
jgi:pimeloyl-ACP methyl ester carboxylesterase